MYLNCGYTYIDRGGEKCTRLRNCDKCNDIYMLNLSEFCYFKSTSKKEGNDTKRPILVEKTLLSHYSFKSVPVSHPSGGITLAFRETVSCIFSSAVRFESAGDVWFHRKCHQVHTIY